MSFLINEGGIHRTRRRVFNVRIICVLVMIVLPGTIMAGCRLIRSLTREVYEARTGHIYVVSATYSWDFSNTTLEELSNSWIFNAPFQAADEINGLDESAETRPGEWVIGDDGGNKVLYQKQDGIPSVALFKGARPKNFVVEFRMKWLLTAAEGQNTGFVFRNTEYQEFYRICALGRFRLLRRTVLPGETDPATERIRWGPSGTFDPAAVTGTWIWIRVEAAENLISFWYSLDGEDYTLYWDCTDSDAILGEGNLGFFAHGPAMFDDFTFKILQ